MSEFTKGKWEADAKTIRTSCKVFRTVRIGDIGDDIAIAVIPATHGISEQELLANTRLVAAAPEMYLMLELCADHFEHIGWSAMAKVCKKLLARIDGEEAQE